MSEALINGSPYPIAVDRDGLQWRVIDVGGEISETWEDWSGGMGECERKSGRGYFFSDGWDATQQGVLRLSPTVQSLQSVALSTGHGYFFEAVGAGAAPTYDTDITGDTLGTAATSLTLGNLNVTTEANRLVLVFVSSATQDIDIAATVTFAGQQCTRFSNCNRTGMSSECWYLVNPPSGNGATVITLQGAASHLAASACSLYGVNQTTPITTGKTDSGSDAAVSLILTGSTTNDLIVCGVGVAGAKTVAAGAGESLQWTDNDGTNITTGGVTQAGAAAGVALTPSWTGAAAFAAIGVAVKGGTATYHYCADASATYLDSATGGGCIWKLRYDSADGVTEVGGLAASTATAGSTSTTLEDSTAPFGEASAYVNRIVRLTGGTGAGQYRRISAHTSSQLTVTAWETTPSTDTTYQILDSYWVSAATFGRPTYFISKWKVPCGAGKNTQELTTVAAPLSLDTWTSKSEPDALHLTTYQKGSVAHIAGASTANTVGSEDSADTALVTIGTSIGDTSTSITDLIECQGFLFPLKEDGMYELDSDGVARLVDGGLSRANVDDSNGRTSSAFGDMIIAPYNSLLRYQIGSGVIPIGQEELPNFRRVENTGINPPLDRRPVATARAGKYLYTCYNSETKSMLEQWRLRTTGDPAGHEWLGHSVRDLSLSKGMFVDSQNRLWLKGADADNDLRAIQVIELDKQGGLNTQYRRGLISEVYTFYGDEWVPNDGDQVQLVADEIELAGGWDAQASLQLQVYRDNGNTAESVGSAITTAGVTIRNWTTGTTDTAYRVRPVLQVTTSATYTPLAVDPVVLRRRIKARKPMIYRCVVDANDAVLQEFGLTAEDARQTLYRLQDQGVINIAEPGPDGPKTATFSAEIVRVTDARYETPQGVGYGIEILLRRYVAD